MDIALHYFDASLSQLEGLLKDVPDERWAEQPAGVRNHAAWTVGHLCCAHHFGLSVLGLESGLPKSWLETMDMGTMPVADRGAYPSKDELWQAHHDTHAKLAAAVKSATPAQLAQVTENEEYRPFFPTNHHTLTYILTLHEAQHFGQAQAWKRAAGLVND